MGDKVRSSNEIYNQTQALSSPVLLLKVAAVTAFLFLFLFFILFIFLLIFSREYVY